MEGFGNGPVRFIYPGWTSSLVVLKSHIFLTVAKGLIQLKKVISLEETRGDKWFEVFSVFMFNDGALS